MEILDDPQEQDIRQRMKAMNLAKSYGMDADKTARMFQAPVDQEVLSAMEEIQELRARFSADTCTEAWRRLGGIEAVNKWRERTRPMPNSGPTVNISFDKETMQRSIASMAKELSKVADARIVECSPSAVTAALKILASGGPSMRCAFCGVPEGSLHDATCPFGGTVTPNSSVPFKPVSTPGKVIPSVTRLGYSAFGSAPAPQQSSAAPKDSILNPPVKGFIGSDKYGYDPDVD